MLVAETFQNSILRPLQSRLEILLLFAHTHVEMLHYSCRDIAAAADRLSDRNQGILEAEESLAVNGSISADRVRECVTKLSVILQDSQEPATGTYLAGAAAAAM
jgi:hypothetical protein